MSDPADTSTHIGGDRSSTISANAQIEDVSERFECGEHVYSTRTADGFRAIDNVSGEKVFLWLLRFPLAQRSEEPARFVRRLSKIEGLDLPIAKFIAYGVDRNGVAYLVMEHFDSHAVIDSSRDAVDLARRFIELVSAVAKLHEAGIILGDVSKDSFALDSNSKVLIIGLLGVFDGGARKTAKLPPGETLNYLSPEQRSGSSPDSSSDVYALGVYSYRLFTGRYLKEDLSSGARGDGAPHRSPAPSKLRSGLPTWADNVIGACLQPDPSKRYRNASDVLRATRGLHALTNVSGSFWEVRQDQQALSKSKPMEKEGSSSESRLSDDDARARRDLWGELDEEPGREGTVLLFAGICALIVGVAIAVGLFFSIGSLQKAPTDTISDQSSMTEGSSDSKVSEVMTTENRHSSEDSLENTDLLRRLALKVTDDQIALQERLVALRQIEPRTSESHRALLAICVASDQPQLTREVFEILSKQTMKFGYANSLLAWVREYQSDNVDRVLAPIARLALGYSSNREVLSETLDQLKPFFNPQLFAVFKASKDPTLLVVAIERMKELLPSSSLVGLLAMDHREVRIAAIKALVGRNDMGVLQDILKSYETEDDELVRDAYRKFHWVAREKTGGVSQ